MESLYAVIFDVDGVLVDSYAAHYEGWLRAGRERGFSITEQQFATSFGRTSREAVREVFGMTTLSDDQIKDLDERKEAIYREIVAESFPDMPGAAQLLDALAQDGFRLAIGSSGPPPNVNVVVDALQRRSLFGAIISGADVIRGKPDPQVFLIGASRIGVPPARCVVIEDAPPGIQAARNAGMRSIGFASTGRTREELSAADFVIDSLLELSPTRIRQLIDHGS